MWLLLLCRAVYAYRILTLLNRARDARIIITGTVREGGGHNSRVYVQDLLIRNYVF